MAKIGRIVGSSLNIDEVYELFAAEARKLIPYDRIAICLHNKQENIVTVAYLSGLAISINRKGDSYLFKGSVNEVIDQTRTGLVFNPDSIEAVRSQFPSLVGSYETGMRSMITVPLISRGKIIGGLNIRSTQAKLYTEDHFRLATLIGDQIAGAIANAQLFKKLELARSSLRESETRFRAIFDQAAIGVAEVHVVTGAHISVNRRYCELLGMSKDEVLAATLREVSHPEDRHLHEEGLARMVAGDIGSMTVEKRVVRKDGTVVWVNVTLSPLLQEGEKLQRGIVVIEDITERKRAEENLRGTLDQLESRVRERTLELEEINTALRVLMSKREADQENLANNLQSNIDQLVMPFMQRLRVNQSDRDKNACLNILETNLRHIVSPFINHLSVAYKKLTPKEIQIADLIKQGKSSKDIAGLFCVSVGTVVTHRNSIRRKLNLKSKDVNLRSHLLFLS